MDSLNLNRPKHLAQLARKYDGWIFAGFVRDFVMAKLDAPNIDIWFKQETTAQEFIAELTSEVETIDVTSFVTLRYNILAGFHIDITLNQTQLKLKVIVCPTFPFTEFINNQVVWDGHTVYNADTITTPTPDCIDVNQLKLLFLVPELRSKASDYSITLKLKQFRDRGYQL